MKLFKINEGLADALETAANEMASNGCVSEATAQKLESLNYEFIDKANAVACVIKNKGYARWRTVQAGTGA